MNKSDIIRKVASENPQLAGKPTAIAKLCASQHNCEVSAAAVNQALKSKKAVNPGAAPAPAKSTAAVKAVKPAKSAGAAKAAKRSVAPVKGEQPGSSCAVDVINAAKSLLQLAGSVDNAKQVIEALTA